MGRFAFIPGFQARICGKSFDPTVCALKGAVSWSRDGGFGNPNGQNFVGFENFDAQGNAGGPDSVPSTASVRLRHRRVGGERMTLTSHPAGAVSNQTEAHVLAATLQRHGVSVVFGQSIPSALFLAATGLSGDLR